MSAAVKQLGPYLQSSQLVAHLKCEDFIVVLKEPDAWDKELQADCLRIVWKWDLATLSYCPWDRSDGAKHYLYLSRPVAGNGEIDATLFSSGNERTKFVLRCA